MDSTQTKVVGHTRTSIARLAASRDIFVADESNDGRSIEDMRFSLAGVSLLNLQGPIPELSEESPGWLETYQRAADRMGVSADEGVRRRGPQIASASVSSGPRRPKPSPYSKHAVSASWDDGNRRPRLLEPAFPAVGFDQVYGKSAQADDDYAHALMSLTELGYNADATALLGGSSSGKGGRVSQNNNSKQLTSKFPLKGGDNANLSGGGRGGGGRSKDGRKYVSSGAGFLHAATSSSVLASIRRMNLARANELAANQKSVEKPSEEVEVKEKKEKPPTVRMSMQFEDGSKYRGDWSTRGLGAHGQGTLTYATVRTEKGVVVPGARYIGGFKRHLFEGLGTYWYSNGDKYSGPWRKGEKAGPNGTFTRASDGAVLVGEWSGDKANGFCKCTYGNGATYEGFYREDMKDGEGCYRTVTGDEYRGEFQQDRILGRGLFIDKKNHTSYHGTFHNSKRHGRTDEEATFGLHHGLFGDFNFRGGETFGVVGSDSDSKQQAGKEDGDLETSRAAGGEGAQIAEGPPPGKQSRGSSRPASTKLAAK